MVAISARELTKTYKVSIKQPGFTGTVSHFINRRYRNITAVNRVNFEIQEGEFVGFIGPNGAGKTTTLKMLCGLIHPSKGNVLVADHSPSQLEKSFLKKITLVMGQKQQLIWDLPPIESLKVNAAIYGLSERDSAKRINELAEMLELSDELNRPVRKLSLGERMKAELLAALIHRPSILFLDEPTLGLDINAQIRVRNFLSTYNKKYGATVILTSHYMADITSLCNRILIIDNGTLSYDGSLSDLTTRLTPNVLLKLKFSTSQDLKSFANLGEIIHSSEFAIEILIPRSKLASSLSIILTNFAVKDLEVTDPPIENLLGKLFST